ncbi:MAG: hypothetical protein JWM90_2129 [Thermoleophilia bacterium]|nr:hypothetical protein [Thermoleophilia bacterium]
MKTGWTTREEREYTQLRDEYVTEGLSEKEARLRAAQVVNAHRAEHGETRPEAHPDKGELMSQTSTTEQNRITGGRQPQPNGRRMHAPATLHEGAKAGHGHRPAGH